MSSAVVERYQRTVTRLEGELQALERQRGELERERVQFADLLDVLEQAREVVKRVGAETQHGLTVRLSGLVTECLQSVLGAGYEFEMLIQERGGSSYIDMFIVDGGEPYDPLEAKGGTVVDVITMALRVSCLVLDAQAGQTLWLDEPFRFVSKNLQPALARMLERLGSSLQVQFMIVTHEPELIRGVASSDCKVFRIGNQVEDA